MKIEVKKEHGYFIAIDAATYDGAKDGNNYYGYGSTELEAVHSLLSTLEEKGLYK
jgi:hypothetical protein